ncbi:uncharacterized protein LOC62_04G005246 [Vanrija pseudolonga]|uniref:F-box domain-containing protein n=1 Tax=Vanrija pseudolonga TaxID=143232 RepID=A0AAF0Y7X2_9TREE|nr:hypothetical protein LOC62_04G005246 [Vanrija pseudolonga]
MTNQTTAMLNAGAFPHILDNILSSVPLADLVRLRGVSRYVRDHIDAKLLKCYHVKLVDHSTECQNNCAPPCGVVRFMRDERTDPDDVCVQDLPVPGTLVKVVDYTGEGTNHLEAVLEHIGTAQTLQRTTTSALLGPFPAQLHRGITTLVDYLRLASLPMATIPVAHPETGEDEYYHQVTVPPSIRRYILHFIFNQVHCEFDSFGLGDDLRFTVPAGTLEEFVLVLWPLFFTPPTGGRLWFQAFQSVPPALARSLTAAAVAAAGGAMTTIVGADRVSPLIFGRTRGCNSPRYVIEQIRKHIRLVLAARFPGDEQKVQEALARVRFVTLQEWWHELGPIHRGYAGGAGVPSTTKGRKRQVALACKDVRVQSVSC